MQLRMIRETEIVAQMVPERAVRCQAINTNVGHGEKRTERTMGKPLQGKYARENWGKSLLKKKRLWKLFLCGRAGRKKGGPDGSLMGCQLHHVSVPARKMGLVIERGGYEIAKVRVEGGDWFVVLPQGGGLTDMSCVMRNQERLVFRD